MLLSNTTGSNTQKKYVGLPFTVDGTVCDKKCERKKVRDTSKNFRSESVKQHLREITAKVEKIRNSKRRG